MANNRLPPPILAPGFADRFWSKVRKTKTGCWYWTGSRDFSTGYGRLQTSTKAANRKDYAHRIAHFLTTGEWPELVEHTCDRGHTGCVRPDHLISSTYSNNNKNAWLQRKGEL